VSDHLFDREAGQGPENPMKAAQEAMRAPLPKRFYKVADVTPQGDGHAVQLDGRTAKTPGRAPLVLATAAAARLVADEFAAQGETIDPATMPCYRLVNTAIDGVAADPQAVLEDVVRFFGTDLVCYRAGEPEALVAAQREKWDGPLAWAEELAGSRFALAEGIMHVAQPRETLAAMGVHLRQIADPVALAALHSMTTLTGSAILALGTLRGAWSADEAWTAAHVDEDFNIAQWGEDAEAKARRARRGTEMDAAARMVRALGE
jgi:chaperone required for assembly of F1-ATPase